jgi:CcmE
MQADGTFRASEVLAKHDETYMPKDVADALKKTGHWNPAAGPPPPAATWNAMQSGRPGRTAMGAKPPAKGLRTEPFDAVTVNDRSWREHVMSLHALQGTVRPRIIFSGSLNIVERPRPR